jgi:transcription elongation factor Elf1
MTTRFYECQDCGKQDTDKTDFKIVKFQNIGMIHCNNCVKDLEEWL